MKLIDYISKRAEHGYCFFTQEQAKAALGCTSLALRRAISRLQEKVELAEPHTGFHVIVPPEYKSLGCIPADQFIPDLMEYYHSPYYVCLLSAAEYLGAAHHRPQVFQVMTARQLKDIHCGKVVIEFITKKDIQALPINKIKTKQGYLHVSTPELTILDLILRPDRAGGLDNIFMVISDLGDQINVKQLFELWDHKQETGWLQRLGYLFELAGQVENANATELFLSNKTFRKRALSFSNEVTKETLLNQRWKLWINEIIEVEQ